MTYSANTYKHKHNGIERAFQPAQQNKTDSTTNTGNRTSLSTARVRASLATARTGMTYSTNTYKHKHNGIERAFRPPHRNKTDSTTNTGNRASLSTARVRASLATARTGMTYSTNTYKHKHNGIE